MVPGNLWHSYIDSTGAPLPRMPDVVRPSVDVAVFNARGEILMQKRADNGFWSLPGGGVEIGESVREAAVRETIEETGLRVAMKRLVGVYSGPDVYPFMSYPGGALVHYVMIVFECDVVGGELRISDESTDIGYFPGDALPEDTLLSHRVCVADALAGRAEPFIR